MSAESVTCTMTNTGLQLTRRASGLLPSVCIDFTVYGDGGLDIGIEDPAYGTPEADEGHDQYVSFTVEEAPNVLMAIQNWIESLNVKPTNNRGA